MSAVDNSAWTGLAQRVGQASGQSASSGHDSHSVRNAERLVRSDVLSAFNLGTGGHGLQGLALALSDAVSSPNASSDPVPGAVQSVQSALDKAAEDLKTRGFDQQTIDTALERFSKHLAAALDAVTPSQNSGGAAPSDATPSQSQTSSVALGTREVFAEKGAIDLVTNEGDHVTIRFRAKDVITSAAAESTSSTGSATAASTSEISLGRVKVTVDGNLNNDELAAINNVLSQVDALATKFFSGDAEGAFAAAAQVGADPAQIASFQMNLTYTHKLSAAAFASTASTQAPDSPSTSVSATSSTSAASAADSASTAGTTDAPAAPSASSATDSSATTARQSIANFLQNVLSSLGPVSGAGKVSFSLSWKMQLLATALPSYAPNDKASSAASMQLAGQTLQKVTA